uniref:Uncharacterized protein n=1 Tax=Anguilla anguilla TaxID=7936 RepID=A0A0E9TM64_ANGAN
MANAALMLRKFVMAVDVQTRGVQQA